MILILGSHDATAKFCLLASTTAEDGAIYAGQWARRGRKDEAMSGWGCRRGCRNLPALLGTLDRIGHQRLFKSALLCSIFHPLGRTVLI